MGVRKTFKRKKKKVNQNEIDRRRIQSYIQLIDNIKEPLSEQTLEVKSELIKTKPRAHLPTK